MSDNSDIEITSVVSNAYLDNHSEKTDVIKCKNGKEVKYEQWFYPIPGMVGITRPIPRFIQYQYGPCMALSIMIGGYYMSETILPTDVFLNYIVIDPYYTFDFPRTMNDFYAETNYPYPCKQIGSTYEIRTFNTKERINEKLGL